jgi:hypothetical protein
MPPRASTTSTSRAQPCKSIKRRSLPPEPSSGGRDRGRNAPPVRVLLSFARLVGPARPIGRRSMPKRSLRIGERRILVFSHGRALLWDQRVSARGRRPRDRVGSPRARPFCGGCTCARQSAEGKLFTCLACPRSRATTFARRCAAAPAMRRCPRRSAGSGGCARTAARSCMRPRQPACPGWRWPTSAGTPLGGGVGRRYFFAASK